MAFVTIVYQIMVYFMLTNLTREPGYQVFMRIQGGTDQNTSSSKDSPDKSLELKKEKLLSFKDIITDLDVDLILLGVFVAGAMYSLLEVSIILMAINKFTWSINYLGTVTIIGIFVAAVFMRCLSRLTSEIDANYLFTIVLITNSVLINILSLPLTFTVKDGVLQVCIIMTCFIFYLVAAYYIRVLSSNLLFMIVPAHSRCYVIGVRQVVLQVSFGVAYFTASSMFQFGTTAYPLFAFVCLAVSLVRLARSPSFLKKYIQ